MANEVLKRDDNKKSVLGAITDDVSQEVRNLRVDPTSNGLIVKISNISSLDARYLQILNNLSDLNDVATARTNLGLVAGGAGDIWVEKAGDTMTGNLNMGGNTFYGNTASGGGFAILSTTHATKGSIQLGESLFIRPDGSAPGATSFGVMQWTNGSYLYEQTNRFFFLPKNDDWQCLTQDGTAFLLKVSGPNATLADRIGFYKGLVSGDYINTAPPTNGLIMSGSIGIGTDNPLQKFHAVGTANTWFLIDGNSSYNSIQYRTGSTNRGYVGTSLTGGYITNSINNGMHIRGETGVCLSRAAIQGLAVGTSGFVWIGSNAWQGTARLNIQAGTSTIAPLKLLSGVSLGTPVAGSLEYTTDDLQFTFATGTARRNLGGMGYTGTAIALTLTGEHEFVNCTGTSSFTVTLPTAVGFDRIYTIFSSSTGTITIATTSSQTISGQASGSITLARWDYIRVRSTNANWLIVG